MNPALIGALERGEIRRGDAFAVAPAPTLASGFPALDAELPGGGWPRGALTELLPGREGLGELGLLLPALARLSQAGGSVLLVAPPHSPHAPAWAAAGVTLDGLRLVFPRSPRDALWAGVEALRCADVAATLLWLDGFFRAGLPANSLRRLQLAAGEGGGAAFCFRPAQLARQASPALLRLRPGGGGPAPARQPAEAARAAGRSGPCCSIVARPARHLPRIPTMLWLALHCPPPPAASDAASPPDDEPRRGLAVALGCATHAR
jgi:hypothetical protein